MLTNKRRGTCYRLIVILLALVSWADPARGQLLPPILPPLLPPAGGQSTRYILRAPNGIGVVQTLCGLIGCDLLQGLGDPLSRLFVIRTSQPSLLFELSEVLGILSIEVDRLVNLVPVTSLITGSTEAPAGLRDRNPVSFYGSTVWNGYASQPAAQIVRAGQARNQFNVEGLGIIGVIDTGVDPNHPALAPVLVAGYDFTRNQAGSASEMADLNQSTVAVVDGGSPAPVNGYTIAVLDQSTVAVVDNPGYAAFGHGTMVAGIVHLVAPTSSIMPLKAFRADGTGYTSDIIRAVYFAVKSGVKALNMSFSMPGQSAALENALDYAVSQSVASAAAAGNDGRETTVYPAGFTGDVMGVGSTSLSDTRSSFSNYGDAVWVAAPGEGIVSTYPFSTYAAGWGTSFSTPFVTGTVGLLVNVNPNMNEQTAAADIAHAKWVGGDLGHGRLDIVGALTAAHSR